MTNEVVGVLPLPRPAAIPPHVPDSLLLQCVEAYLAGEREEPLALALDLSIQQFYSVVKTAEWRHLQNAFRDKFIATTGGRLIRLENKLIDKIEDYVEHGITMWFNDKDGQPQSYSREITPKEAVSIALMLNETNKRIDKLRDGDVSRKRFDSARLIQELEGVAKRIPEAKSA